jgi:hypothetical protein
MFYIYLVERQGSIGWDEYYSFVCIAESAEVAASTPPTPAPSFFRVNTEWGGGYGDEGAEGWVDARVTCIGVAHGGQALGVVMSSFKAG